jgi:hypothetical protein
MSAKRRMFDTRTILIVLFVIVAIAAAYIAITNLPPEENTLTPGEVITNKDHYLDGDPIVVKGLYDITTEGAVIVSTMSTLTARDELRLDYSNVNNATSFLITGQKYKFTGSLTYEDTENPLLRQIIFIAEDIEIV